MKHSEGRVLSDAEREMLRYTGGAPPTTGGYSRPKVQTSRLPKQPAPLPPAAPPAEKAPAGAAAPTSMDIINPVETSLEQTSNIIIAQADLGEECVGTVTELYKHHGLMRVEGKDKDIYFSPKICFGLYAALRHGDKVDCYVRIGERGLWACGVRRVRTSQ